MTLTTKHMFAIFIPAILLVAFGVFIQIIGYAPTDPNAYVQKKIDAAPALVPIFSDDPIIGRKDAALTLIAFEDLGCARCTEQLSLLTTIIEAQPKKLKVIWKGLPVTRIPYPSDLSHAYAYCANSQNKFVPFANALANANATILTEDVLLSASTAAGINTTNLATCLSIGKADDYQKRVEALARDLNIQTVPTMFLDNKQIEPPTSIDGWQALLSLSATP